MEEQNKQPIPNAEAIANETDTEPEEPQPKQSDTSLDNDEGYKEYCEVTIPNVFEMKLGSNVLQAHQLAGIIIDSYKIIISKDKVDKLKESYVG